ncbi:GNAT family N-acetyltransferase [Aeromonas caviae]|uniref:GNAT family N-acetyltransferase n=1 Tax=Aeromonas caviae TaxID=648 RepID=UPI00244AC23C|nr:GNAT family N-acetyltransferase [Aeromonas caviae]MDH0316880.1 GNAT family N-acetyltransferase [Aeromonas caviae]MDH1450154.1 GNAT family N-acetyltransferase [Aeromonas caviae]MDH1455836.1 GNAT family N-acetyltransferase [Aeromonas caviae]MDH1496217.1 GNAT family N-acetyltransferase [Aeromonas caviae]
MDLLIEGRLWQPRWQGVLQAWQHQGHRWWLLLGKGEAREMAPWAACPPNGILFARDLLAAWLEADAALLMTGEPSRQILIAGSGALLTLAKESGLITLGPRGADQTLGADEDLASALQALLARRLTTPVLRETGGQDVLVLRPLAPADESAIQHYCSDEALARYTLNIPHPYPDGAARDWLAMSGRKAALGLGRTWALTLPIGDEPAPLLGVISLHWHGELAWWVGAPWQNRGLATRAGHLVRQFAFEQWHLPALTARHMPGNLASGRVMEKTGMHHDGRRPDPADGALVLDHWRLDRPARLTDARKEVLAPWLDDEEVVVAILHGEGVALFMVGEVTKDEQTLSGLTVRRYPQAMLAPEAPGVQAHGGGALLKECGDLGLAYLRRLRQPDDGR